jgi:rhodanese-related sulfurtransferase
VNLWQRVQGMLGGKKSTPSPRPSLPIQDDEPEIVVPEITVEELRNALAQPEPPLVLDVREPYEWRLVRMAAARHLPMNDVPAQLETLPRDRAVVVLCAHGSRSYSVAAWLIEQGINASSLDGGITDWARCGGAIEQG